MTRRIDPGPGGNSAWASISDHLHCVWTCAPPSACTVVAQPVNPVQN